MQGVCHRDLKLENTLLDGRPAPRLKICDFGYSKVSSTDRLQTDSVLHTQPLPVQSVIWHLSCMLQCQCKGQVALKEEFGGA